MKGGNSTCEKAVAKAGAWELSTVNMKGIAMSWKISGF
jgi:hypothetical protein